ncbi:hypothetical protein RGQ29_003039 [Quercus rubra]|uniref:Fe2OG dioxygenase domain-containing protein n=1 Tax=Quercus rubra TaxID=3512 RepID=A0AAN7EAH7_QUERU|nr:hypothetical protein RGQ29_003039 [Quercus rubra]
MGLRDENGGFVFDSAMLRKQANLPSEFLWPQEDLVEAQEELNEPLIDLGGFKRGDEVETARAAELLSKACSEHGFFQVTNHGIDATIIQAAHNEIDTFFNMPLDKKLSLRKKPGSLNANGYSGAHAHRFSSKLPWKETYTLLHHENDPSNPNIIVDYCKSVMGEDFEHTGWICQRYCNALKELGLLITELLAISLGVDRFHYRNFFEDCVSMMRCNYYPPCQNPGLTFGTGPHCDPNSLTILHQDQVGGLEVFSNNKWKAIRPEPGALVVNIGDTFMALCNGRYKSCLHRAMVNRNLERKTIAFFLSPREDRVVRPPQELVSPEEPRKYPDFTWPEFWEFSQKHYRSDVTTIDNFIKWKLSSKPSGTFTSTA